MLRPRSKLAPLCRLGVVLTDAWDAAPPGKPRKPGEVRCLRDTVPANTLPAERPGPQAGIFVVEVELDGDVPNKHDCVEMDNNRAARMVPILP